MEPFAGSAGHSLRHASHDVVLVEKYPVLAEIWRFLTSAKPSEVMAIPPVEAVDDLPAWVCQPARDLVGFSLNDGTTSPRKVLTSGLKKLRDRSDSKRKFCGWTEARRARVASQMPAIRHWRVIEGDYTAAPDIEATWFVDPPYIGRAGEHYVHGSGALDFGHLGGWCESRRGQTIVCEGEGATWLPFKPHVNAKAFPARQGSPVRRVSRESVWTNEQLQPAPQLSLFVPACA